MDLEYDDHVQRPLTDQYILSLGEGDGDDYIRVPLVISIDGDHLPLHPGDSGDPPPIRSKVGETIRDLAFRTGKVTHGRESKQREYG